MLIKLTPIVGEKTVLVQETIIDNVGVDSKGMTLVFFSKKISGSGNPNCTSNILVVKEAPEDIYEQQFKTC